MSGIEETGDSNLPPKSPRLGQYSGSANDQMNPGKHTYRGEGRRELERRVC